MWNAEFWVSHCTLYIYVYVCVIFGAKGLKCATHNGIHYGMHKCQWQSQWHTTFTEWRDKPKLQCHLWRSQRMQHRVLTPEKCCSPACEGKTKPYQVILRIFYFTLILYNQISKQPFTPRHHRPSQHKKNPLHAACLRMPPWPVTTDMLHSPSRSNLTGSHIWSSTESPNLPVCRLACSQKFFEEFTVRVGRTHWAIARRGQQSLPAFSIDNTATSWHSDRKGLWFKLVSTCSSSSQIWLIYKDDRQMCAPAARVHRNNYKLWCYTAHKFVI